MRSNLTLKSVLNRQYVAQNSLPSLGAPSFGRRRPGSFAADRSSVSFKPFARVYPIAAAPEAALERAPALACSQ